MDARVRNYRLDLIKHLNKMVLLITLVKMAPKDTGIDEKWEAWECSCWKEETNGIRNCKVLNEPSTPT